MAEIHLVFVGIPLAFVAVLAAMIFTRKGPHPKTYTMSEEWTHPPILWASDEPADHGGHGSHLTVGGGASGNW
jgi:hypothetical protein